MSRIAVLAHSRIALALMAALAVAGCAKKNGGLPDNASGLGLDGAGGAGGLNGRGGNAAPGTSQDFTVNVGDRIFFDTDSSVARADAQQILTAQARWLNQYSQYSITVEGHADERGSREYNLGLGERRGNAVSSALQANGGSGSQITVVSYGEERPTCTQSSEDCWAKNRRVEIVYTAK